MTQRLFCLMLTTCWISSSFAGHGFMNAFGDVEWLPEPGKTPNQLGYEIDNWQERATLALASSEERFEISLKFAREKLAEVESMVIQEDRVAAQIAVDRYRDHLVVATQSLADQTGDVLIELNLRFANALLEHRYVLSVNYLDLPRDSRPTILGVIDAANASYETVAKKLTPKVKDSLFFKEEEVRWSVELARQADAQGL